MKNVIKQKIDASKVIQSALKHDDINELSEKLDDYLSKQANILEPAESEALVSTCIKLVENKIYKQKETAGAVANLSNDDFNDLQNFINEYFNSKLKFVENQLGLKISPIHASKEVEEDFGIKQKISTFAKGITGNIEPLNKEDIFDLNKELTQREGSACENLLESIDLLNQELLDQSYLSQKSASYQHQWQKTLASLSLNIRHNLGGMMQAETREECALYYDGLKATLNSISLHFQDYKQLELKHTFMLNKLENTIMNLNSSEDANKNYEVVSLITDYLKKYNPEKYTEALEADPNNYITQIIPDELKDKKNKTDIITETFELLKIEIENDFNEKKINLLKQIRNHAFYMHARELNLLAALRIAERNAEMLYETRLTFLESHPKMNQFDSIWEASGLGIAMIALAIVVPGLGLPAVMLTCGFAIGLGAIAAGYGTLDLSHITSDTLTKKKFSEFGKRQDENLSPEVQKLLPYNRAQKLKEEKKNENRLIVAGITVASAGLAIGVATLGLVLLGGSGVGLLALGAIGIGVAVVGSSILIARAIKARRKLQKAKKMRNQLHETLTQEIKTLKTVEEQKSLKPQPAPKTHLQQQSLARNDPQFVMQHPKVQEPQITHHHPLLASNPWVFREIEMQVQDNKIKVLSHDPEIIKTRMARLKEAVKRLPLQTITTTILAPDNAAVKDRQTHIKNASFEEDDHVLYIHLTYKNGHKALIIAHPNQIETNDFSDDNIIICSKLAHAMGWQKNDVMVNEQLNAKTAQLAHDTLETVQPPKIKSIKPHP